MDVIAMHQAGFTNAVASLGTAFTSQHAMLIKRYTDQVILTYDSDGAGVKAALRAIPILKEVGISCKVLNMKPYKDPDEFIKNMGAEAFQERIDQAQNSFLFEIEVLKRDYNLEDPEQKTNFYNAVARKLLEFPEALERDNYTQRAIYPLSGTEAAGKPVKQPDRSGSGADATAGRVFSERTEEGERGRNQAVPEAAAYLADRGSEAV